jgi:hypothetical protein
LGGWAGARNRSGGGILTHEKRERSPGSHHGHSATKNEHDQDNNK